MPLFAVARSIYPDTRGVIPVSGGEYDLMLEGKISLHEVKMKDI